MKEIPAEIRVFYDAQLVRERVPETSPAWAAHDSTTFIIPET